MYQAMRRKTRQFPSGPCDRCGVEAEEKRDHYFDHMCPSCRREYCHLKERAQATVLRAVKDGILIRPLVCELCGDTPGMARIYKRHGDEYRTLIVAHHANGYESPLDVWWICHSCNQRMKGYQFHSGQVTRDQARTHLGVVAGE